MINYINENNTTGIITFVDYEKAFDTVNWNFLYDCMETMNFGKSLIGAIRTLYKNIETCVTNNGYSSSFFKPTRASGKAAPSRRYSSY